MMVNWFTGTMSHLGEIWAQCRMAPLKMAPLIWHPVVNFVIFFYKSDVTLKVIIDK